jgi:hypothetical protein
MTKADLVERVSERIKLTKKQTELIVNTLLPSPRETKWNCEGLVAFACGSVTHGMAETPRQVRASIFPLKESLSSRPAKNCERWWTTNACISARFV